ADVLMGGAGNDLLNGGPGADLYRFAGNWGRDVVQGFDDGSDRLDLRGAVGVSGIADLTIFQQGNHVHIVAGDNRIVVRNTDVADIDETDFLFGSPAKARGDGTSKDPGIAAAAAPTPPYLTDGDDVFDDQTVNPQWDRIFGLGGNDSILGDINNDT